VKLVIEEAESAALERHVGEGTALVTSGVALAEVPRATGLANPASEVREATQRLLGACLLIHVSDTILRSAAGLASASLRSLDAIHLASALHVDPDEVIAYDWRLVQAANRRGLAVASPGTHEQH